MMIHYHHHHHHHYSIGFVSLAVDCDQGHEISVVPTGDQISIWTL